MKNHYVLVLSIFGLLCLNHTARAMEAPVPNRSDQTVKHMLRYRAFTNEQLLNELNNLEDQFSTFMSVDDFTTYMHQPDKLDFLMNQMANGGGDRMPEKMFYCAQKIIAVLSLMRYRALTGGQLMEELTNLERQLRGLLVPSDFAEYTRAPDKIKFLYAWLATFGREMSPETRQCIKSTITVLLALQAKRQRGHTE